MNTEDAEKAVAAAIHDSMYGVDHDDEHRAAVVVVAALVALGEQQWGVLEDGEVRELSDEDDARAIAGHLSSLGYEVALVSRRSLTLTSHTTINDPRRAVRRWVP